MGKNILDVEAVARRHEDGIKTCPRCGFDLPATAELAEKHWYITKKGLLSPYCRGCTKFTVVRTRREIRNGRPPKRAVCSICEMLRNVERWDESSPICPDCHVGLLAANNNVPDAMAVLRELVDHNRDVERRREAHISDRPFFPHPDSIFGGYPAYDHRDCIRAEESARAVLRYLTRRPLVAAT